MSVLGETRRMMMAPVAEGLMALALGTLVLAGRAVAAVDRALNAWSDAREARHALAQLGSLDDHMLQDIGITRADVRDAASAPLGADPTRLLALRVTERRAARYLARRDQRTH